MLNTFLYKNSNKIDFITIETLEFTTIYNNFIKTQIYQAHHYNR